MNNQSQHNLLQKYQAVRTQTAEICLPLETDDYIVQSMPDVSPIKWHLAHTTWFFEIFILIPYIKDYPVFNSSYHYLFNSYYETLGGFHPRSQRGLLSRPTVKEIYQYRRHVDEYIPKLKKIKKTTELIEAFKRLELGIHHEQQHQELMLMDIKFNFGHHPLLPVYLPEQDSSAYIAHDQTLNSINSITNSVSSFTDDDWLIIPKGLYEIGWSHTKFAFDNEKPCHSIYLADFAIDNRLITNQEFLEFMSDGGYQNPVFWLADGWQAVQTYQWQHPLYWQQLDNTWWEMTLHGLLPLAMDVPVAHISYYEADAFAKWAHARLPLEAEWEIAASNQQNKISANFLESGELHPVAACITNSKQFFGDLWEWTQSPYLPFPGFKPFTPPFTEYNGKFTCNQYVLRGGSAITPTDHIRLTYRNFYYPHQRWPFTGIRLARSI